MVRVFLIGALFVTLAGASVYVIEALAPDLSPFGRFLVSVPIFVGGGWAVRAAAERRRRERWSDEVS
ncbi:hypothetical protein ACFQ8E_11400 [Isoptericola sp. NPDC056573]|uniref:hypothetical protein n=1 Tax=Isoptericola sp. NPDC056573 TaxID=3345868 RepID=UPI0036CEDDD4